MKSKTISNSKFKNSGVLFECLVRQITAETLAGRPNSPALNIMKVFFNTSTELGKELQLYRAFIDIPKALTESKALDYINLILEQRKRLDERKLAKEKYNLVNEIQSNYSLKEFLSCKIPNYTILASIYKTFLNEISKNKEYQIVNIRDVATARFTLVEHLLKLNNNKRHDQQNSALLEEYRKESEEMRLLAYKYAIDKFNEKYANLNDKQKNLLREYIHTVSDNSFVEYVKNEVPQVQRALLNGATNFNDEVTTIKLNEVAHQLDSIISRKEIRDNEVTALMIAYEILKEINNG